MSETHRGGELFIVDNSISGWTGLRYLRDWTELAHSFDIATGFFEIGSLLDLDGQWQKLDKIRILMGTDVAHSSWWHSSHPSLTELWKPAESGISDAGGGIIIERQKLAGKFFAASARPATWVRKESDSVPGEAEIFFVSLMP